jgi:hypothetical protein
MAIVLLAIGAIFGHAAAMRQCRLMMGPWGGGHCHCMKPCCEMGERWHECGLENKFEGEKEICSKEKGGWWFGHKECKPGCTCPMCTKMRACMQEPNKPVCPMTEQKGK